ncbi:MAG: hypothetical protein QM537_09805, partial [Candidatus Symbiobacter sp.]|nr:hypothetical protein [Candidatus Symbiobacter sp.]
AKERQKRERHYPPKYPWNGYFESGNPPGVLRNKTPGGLPDRFMPLRGKNLRVMTLLFDAPF